MVMLTRQSLGQGPRDVSVYEQQSLVDSYAPSTNQVTGAFIDEAFEGVGTLEADFRASAIENAGGASLTSEGYKESEYFRTGIDYYDGMTTGAAQLLAENQDEVDKRNFIIGRASTGQQVLGFGASFIAGMAEPKNLGIGIATALVGGAVISRVGSVRRMYQLSMRARKFQTRAGVGALEGLVASAALEPSNIDSAKILQQDYGMADSVMNVALSTVLGAGLNSVPGFIGDKMKLRKLNRVTPELQAELLDEVDMALGQASQSKQVDVSSVEKTNQAKLSNADVATKAQGVEHAVRYTDTTEFATLTKGTKVLGDDGKPQIVYHGTDADFNVFREDLIGARDEGFAGRGFYFTNDKGIAGEYTTTGQVKPSYLSLKNPLVVSDYAEIDILVGESVARDRSGAKSARVRDKLREMGHDGVIVTDSDLVRGVNEFVVFEPEQIVPAYGGGDINVLARSIDADSDAALANAIEADTAITNDTAIDWDAARELNDFEKVSLDEQVEYESEIADLRDQGLLTEADELALEQINDMDLDSAIAAHEAAYFCLTKG